MRDSLFWRIAAILAIAAGLYIGHGLHDSGRSPLLDPFLASSAMAGGVDAMSEDTDYFVTASEDGRQVYVWEFNGGHEPRLRAEAVVKK